MSDLTDYGGDNWVNPIKTRYCSAWSFEQAQHELAKLHAQVARLELERDALYRRLLALTTNPVHVTTKQKGEQ